jgi:hypothetical protein
MIQRKVHVEVSPSPEELAFEFSIMGDEQQAMFFNELARITENWDRPFCFQLQSLTDNQELTDAGRSVMRAIGEYAGARAAPPGSES